MVFDKFRQRKALQKDLKNREEELRQIQLQMAYGPFSPPSYDEVTKDKLENAEPTTPPSSTRTDSTTAYSTRSESTSSASSAFSVR